MCQPIFKQNVNIKATSALAVGAYMKSAKFQSFEITGASDYSGIRYIIGVVTVFPDVAHVDYRISVCVYLTGVNEPAEVVIETTSKRLVRDMLVGGDILAVIESGYASSFGADALELVSLGSDPYHGM